MISGMNRKRVCVCLGALACVFVLAVSPAVAANEPTEKELLRRGAKMWSAYCGKCHNPRPGGEFNRLEWDILMLHMRVRANLPARDSEALRVYLRQAH